jgi:hypothetical protein
MRTHIAAVIAALGLASCMTAPNEAQYSGSAFSFSQCERPSLMDINAQRYQVPVADGVYRLTNIHSSFAGSFVLLHDERRREYVIQDKNGRKVFVGYLDGVPRYAACVDIDRNGSLDVLIELASYGNHGNGTESFEVLVNRDGFLSRLASPISFDFTLGQENKAGMLTWYSAPEFCAVFVGEEADVTVHGTEIRTGEIRKVREMWGHKNGRMWLITKSSVTIDRQAAKCMRFR